MRSLLALILLTFVLALSVSHLGAQVNATSSDPASSPSPRLKISPKLNPRMVELLQDQADQRKSFYDVEAKSKNDLKIKQNDQVQRLLEKHRAARSEFSKEKHSAEERGAFYHGQRDEMAALKSEQKKEKADLLKEMKAKLSSFYAEQKQKRRALETELRVTK